MIKLFEEYVKCHKFDYGDYIVCNIRYYRTDGKNYNSIIRIVDTPGPKGHKINYYSAYVLYKYDNGELEELKWDDPMVKDTIEYDQQELEKNALFSTRDEEKAIEIIKMLGDTEKYNL